MPPTKKYENPWVGFELTPSRDMLDIDAITTTQRGPVKRHALKTKVILVLRDLAIEKRLGATPLNLPWSQPNIFV